ncbi:hypothetical protein QVD17_04283 [Tagetes erecta]|uniref:Uncharacterized protein n=1 Tax=Tagetes erecta TaxID=13708 RepID=A0AAD8LCW2_TARER|nr:hypothetical protein QVD17_04283 [Tagetes erecta]
MFFLLSSLSYDACLLDASVKKAVQLDHSSYLPVFISQHRVERFTHHLIYDVSDLHYSDLITSYTTLAVFSGSELRKFGVFGFKQDLDREILALILCLMMY